MHLGKFAMKAALKASRIDFQTFNELSLSELWQMAVQILVSLTP